MTNGLKQGQYKLKGERKYSIEMIREYFLLDFLWEDEFDPLHVLSRIYRRDLFETTMQRYTKW
jgi:hypothetical protein